MKNLNNYVIDLAKQFNINIKDKVAEKCLCEYVENIIFNVVSIASIIALINNSKNINLKVLEIMNKYIFENCNKKITGGGGSIVLPSEFYGIDSGRYSISNNTSDILSINFESGLMRPQIGGGNKSCIEDEIEKILKKHNMKASSSIIKKMCKLIEDYLKCLFKKLGNSKNKISSTTIKNTIKANKMFHIFK